jgi:hypothetical protein
MAGPRNNPKIAVNVDDYRDMMISLVVPPPDADTERCCHCHREIGVCECIPGEAAILNDEFDSHTVVDAEFESV